MIRKMLSENVLLDLGKQRELVEAAADSLTVDQTLKLFDLAAQMQSVTPGASTSRPCPTSGTARTTPVGTSCSSRTTDTLHAFFADLSADSGPRRPEARHSRPRSTRSIPAEVIGRRLQRLGRRRRRSGLPPTTSPPRASPSPAPATPTPRLHRHRDPLRRRRRGTRRHPGCADPRAPPPPSRTTSPRATMQLVIGSDFNGVGEALSTPAPSTRRPPRARTRGPRPTPTASTEAGDRSVRRTWTDRPAVVRGAGAGRRAGARVAVRS